MFHCGNLQNPHLFYFLNVCHIFNIKWRLLRSIHTVMIITFCTLNRMTLDFGWQCDRRKFVTCIVIDAPQPPHQTDPHHKGSEDNSHQWSSLHHRAWRHSVHEGVSQQVKQSHRNTEKWPNKWCSLPCSRSGLTGGETLSLLVFWPAGGLSSLGTSELIDWVTTMGLERFLISHCNGNTGDKC